MKITVDGIDQPMKRFTFAGGEVQIRLEEIGVPDGFGGIKGFVDGLDGEIRADLRNSEDVMALLMATDALRRRYPSIEIDLEIPYLPYARQDRVCAPGEALALRVMCDLINRAGYRTVRVWDVHSDVALALLDRVEHMLAAAFMPTLLESWPAAWGKPHVVAPDAGAMKRASLCAKVLGAPVTAAEKIRNPMNGEILTTTVHCAHIGDDSFLMVDDICDGGRTFIALAKFLTEMTNNKIVLYVTHGIFSAGFEPFNGVIDHIFCANPIGLGDRRPSCVTVL